VQIAFGDRNLAVLWHQPSPMVLRRNPQCHSNGIKATPHPPYALPKCRRRLRAHPGISPTAMEVRGAGATLARARAQNQFFAIRLARYHPAIAESRTGNPVLKSCVFVSGVSVMISLRAVQQIEVDGCAISSLPPRPYGTRFRSLRGSWDRP
jgi:hypothetical protein